jgi:type III secretion system low calcium response chaperone LcrH/SycD
MGFIEDALAALSLPGRAAKSWSPEEEDTLYAAAYGLYEQGAYARAAEMFTQLVHGSPFTEVYWRGLASSRQMEERYQEALRAWCLTALLAEHDPLPHFHAAECLLSLGDREEALKALHAAEDKAYDRPELLSTISVLKEAHA